MIRILRRSLEVVILVGGIARLWPRHWNVLHVFFGALFLIAAIVEVIRSRRRAHETEVRSRSQNGLCPTCGYNLLRNESGFCPECGSAFEIYAGTSRGRTIRSV